MSDGVHILFKFIIEDLILPGYYTVLIGKCSPTFRRILVRLYSEPSSPGSVTLFTFRHLINFPPLVKHSHMRSNFPSVFLSSTIYTRAITCSASLRRLQSMQLISAIYFKLCLWIFYVIHTVHVPTFNISSNMWTLWYTPCCILVLAIVTVGLYLYIYLGAHCLISHSLLSHRAALVFLKFPLCFTVANSFLLITIFQVYVFHTVHILT
jgi:hypothetical protein